MATVLVTGYGGFLGAAIARQLLAQGYTVRGLARGQYDDLVAEGVVAYQGSINQPEAVEAALCGADAVVHTAAKAGVWGPYNEYYTTNTAGTQLLLQTAQRVGCQAFVYSSSPSVTFAATNQSGIDETAPYPTRWLCHYPYTKALGEQAVLQAGRAGAIWTAALRPHLIWGKGDPHLMPRVVQRARAGQLRRVGSGQNLIDIVHVDNAATAHLLALERLLASDQAVNGQAFFITDGKPIACWDWISQILGTAGVAVPSGWISYGLAYRLGAALEGLHYVTGNRREPRMTRFVAAQLALDHYFSIDKARRLLGYAPRNLHQQRLEECRSWLSRGAA